MLLTDPFFLKMFLPFVLLCSLLAHLVDCQCGLVSRRPHILPDFILFVTFFSHLVECAALQGPSGHLSYATAGPPIPGVGGKSYDGYLFSVALDQLRALKVDEARVLFAWSIVAGDDCCTTDIGLPLFQEQVQAAGFSFIGAMAEMLFPCALRDDTPCHLINEGPQKRTGLLIASLRALGVVGGRVLALAAIARATVFGYENRQPDRAALRPLPMA